MPSQPDFRDQVLAWLLAHPGSTAQEIAFTATTTTSERVRMILTQAAQAGLVRRDQEGRKAPRWTAVTPRPPAQRVICRVEGVTLAGDGPDRDFYLELPGYPQRGDHVQVGGRNRTVRHVTWIPEQDAPVLTLD